MRTERELVLKVLDDNDYTYNTSVVEDIIEKSKIAKADLIAKLRQMPGWNEEAQAVIFDTDIIRSIDPEACMEVISWMKSKLYDILPEAKKVWKKREVEEILNKLRRLRDGYNYLQGYGEVVEPRLSEINKEIKKFEEVMEFYETKTFSLNYGKRVIEEDAVKYRNFERTCNVLFRNLKEGNHTLTEDAACLVNNYFEELKVVAGQKVSRVFGKLCKLVKLNTVEDWVTDYNGNQKNYGYNYQFAKFGDAVNPLNVPRYVLLSVHAVDFLYMSNGNSWASCHTIIEDGAWGYRGEYSAGTISYLLDPCSMIFYTVDKEFNEDDFCIAPKQQRCVFAYNDGVLYQGRVYPDGRDGGDLGLSAQFRSIVQKLFADVEGKANLWTKVSNKHEYIEDLDGLAYHDWEYYDDTNVTTLNEIENYKHVKINTEPICINCGRRHSESGNISCCDGDTAECCQCGRRTDVDSGSYIDGEFYCCDNCIYEAGYRWCDDVQEWIYRDNCFEDTRTGDYFYNSDDMVETEDGNIYRNSISAERDGYGEDDYGKWYPNDELYIDDYTGECFHAESKDDVYIFDGHCYMSLENAKLNGEEVDEEVIA